MQGMVVNFLCVRQLYHFTKIHNGDSVGNVTDHQKIMGDEQVGQAHLILEFIKHIDDLGLDGYVQGGHRLVANHKLGVHGHSPGNADTLPLAAGELVGITVGVLRVQAHLGHQLQHPLLPLLLGGVHLVHVQRLGDDVGDSHAGIQRGIGVLENHCGLLPVVQNVLLGFDLLAVEEDLAGGGLIQVQERAANGGFAAAGLAHQAQGLPPVDGEGNIVHSLQRLGGKGTGGDIEVLLQVLDFNKGISHWSFPPFPFLPSRSSSRLPDDRR